MATRRPALVAIWLVAAATTVAPSAASGTFVATTVATAGNVSTATLAAPTSLSAVRGTCVFLTSTAVNLSWTATSSTFADGYQIFRSTTSGSGYASIGSVSGRSTTTFTDTTVTFSTTYYYVVQATKLAWRSGNSNPASVTTPTLICV